MSKLRRPCFQRGKLPHTYSDQAADADDAIRGIGQSRIAALPSSGQLANYTRQRLTSLLAERDNAASLIGDCGPAQRSDEGINNDGSNHEKNDTGKKNDPNMEQCIMLLEPSLKIFQSSCMQNEKARAKNSKKQQLDGKNKGKDAKGGQEGDAKDEDEVPPQLLRLSRFFHFRWLPMKKALLRPPPSAPDDKSTEASDVEVGIHYRLRLARACWKKGLVAAAEYESLKGAFESGMKKNKRKRRDDATDDDDGDGEFRKKLNNENSADGGGERNLMERVRLSLVRLPTDAIRPERSLAAWRHVKEMILECCSNWEKMDESQRHGGKPRGCKTASELTPDQLADWTMTSWTAILLSRGMDCFTSAATRHPASNNSISSVEKHVATLLSDRTLSNNPTLLLARAAASRIDDLLSPENLKLLNGAHLYSLGKLFASFHSRGDAETHIVTSICKCSSAGGMAGLEQLARLLSVYSCCISAATKYSNSEVLAANSTESRTAVRDLEGRLRVKIDNDENAKRFALEKYDKARAKECVNKNRGGSAEAKSFLEAVLHATAHLVKCFN